MLEAATRTCAVVFVVLSLLRVLVPVEECRVWVRTEMRSVVISTRLWPWQDACRYASTSHVPMTAIQAAAFAGIGVLLWRIAQSPP